MYITSIIANFPAYVMSPLQVAESSVLKTSFLVLSHLLGSIYFLKLEWKKSNQSLN